MRIKSATVFPLRLPFTDGSAGTGLMPMKWTHLDVALLRLKTEDGIADLHGTLAAWFKDPSDNILVLQGL